MFKATTYSVFLIFLTACPKTPSGSEGSQSSLTPEDPVKPSVRPDPEDPVSEWPETTPYSEVFIRFKPGEEKHIPDGDLEFALLLNAQRSLEMKSKDRTSAGDSLTRAKLVIQQICERFGTWGTCSVLFKRLENYKEPDELKSIKEKVINAETEEYDKLDYFDVFRSGDAQRALDWLK